MIVKLQRIWFGLEGNDDFWVASATEIHKNTNYRQIKINPDWDINKAVHIMLKPALFATNRLQSEGGLQVRIPAYHHACRGYISWVDTE